ncbi:hypothetical protein Pelo_750 [Pelomyxa schiedti]|nr:hypothetical protein Pelo_750 [Pelomyxa schiedti]
MALGQGNDRDVGWALYLDKANRFFGNILYEPSWEVWESECTPRCVVKRDLVGPFIGSQARLGVGCQFSVRFFSISVCSGESGIHECTDTLWTFGISVLTLGLFPKYTKELACFNNRPAHKWIEGANQTYVVERINERQYNIKTHDDTCKEKRSSKLIDATSQLGLEAVMNYKWWVATDSERLLLVNLEQYLDPVVIRVPQRTKVYLSSMESDLGVVVLPGTPNYQLKSINLQQTWVTETLAFTDSTPVFHPASLGRPDFCAKDVLILHTISNRHAFVASVESGRCMEAAFQFSCDSSPRRITYTTQGVSQMSANL